MAHAELVYGVSAKAGNICSLYVKKPLQVSCPPCILSSWTCRSVATPCSPGPSELCTISRIGAFLCERAMCLPRSNLGCPASPDRVSPETWMPGASRAILLQSAMRLTNIAGRICVRVFDGIEVGERNAKDVR
eukprot:scaffold223_cov408-Prasinococcus_capsulatus_cf.AAC.2